MSTRRWLAVTVAALLVACGPDDEANYSPYGNVGDATPGDAAEASLDGGTMPDTHAEAGEDGGPVDGVGLRYYGCNGSGDSCPDPDDPLNTQSNSGPSFLTERFDGHGGTVLPQYLFIGRAFVPTGGA